MKQEFRKKKIYIAGGICCIVLIIIGYCYGSRQNGNSAAIKSKNIPLVQTYTVSRADMMRHISLFGATVADANVAVAPKYTGRILAVNVKLGDQVKKGDVLMIQDTGDVDISIHQNQAATKVAQANAIEAEATYDANYLKAKNAYAIEQTIYDRNQYLFSIGAISQEALDTIQQSYIASKSDFEVLENQRSQQGDIPAAVESKQAAIDQALYATQALEKQRNDLILIAPRDGVIGYRAAEVGAIAAAGTKVLEIVDNSHNYVDCSVPESDAALLQPGSPIQMTVDSLGEDCSGTVIYVSPSVDAAAKTYTVRIELQPTAVMKAGMFAHGQIDILQRPQTLYIPKDAVFEKNGQNFVFVVDGENMVQLRMVTIGLVNDEFEEILTGLVAGDFVAVGNQDKLKDGMNVEREN